MTSVTFNVPDISCEHCQRAITSALLPVKGIATVRVDIPTTWFIETSGSS